MWEEGVRVGWGMSVRNRGGSDSRIAYIADLYNGGRAAINLARSTHKFDWHLFILVLKRVSCHISIDAAIFSFDSASIFCDCDL